MKWNERQQGRVKHSEWKGEGEAEGEEKEKESRVEYSREERATERE